MAAQPDIKPVGVAPARATRDGVDMAVVQDDQGRSWVVAAPRGAASGAALEAEVEAVTLLAGRVPFVVPRPVATVALREGGHAVVYPAPTGRAVDLTRLASSPLLCQAIGRSLAALHQVSPNVVERAGVPVYEADDIRRRRLSELDRGAATGQVPSVLLQRWEAALDDEARWRFTGAVVHGDLVAERVLVSGDDVSALLDWTDVHVGDPAQDLAWLAVGAEPETVTAVLQAYVAARGPGADEFLLERAVLHGEMALLKWLLHGERTGAEAVSADARDMLSQLAGWVSAEAEADAAEAEALAAAAAARERVEMAAAQEAEEAHERAVEARERAQAAAAAEAQAVAGARAESQALAEAQAQADTVREGETVAATERGEGSGGSTAADEAAPDGSPPQDDASATGETRPAPPG